ncbi:MAG TPA: class I SAM-dependent methyltransferase [Candidatus Paceibacterota bacterium]
MDELRRRIYANHISTMFGDLHDIDDIESEYRIHSRYFRKNYGPFLPDDKSASIADLGCGFGHFLHFLKENGYRQSVGVDVSPDIVSFARGKGFTVFEEDSRAFLLKRATSFDCIVMNDLIELLTKEEILSMLDAVRAALKPGGRLIVKTPNMGNPFLAASSMHMNFSHETSFNEVSLAEACRIAGFRDVLVKGTDIYVFYANPFNYPAKFAARILSGSFYLVNWLYGRTSIRIFEKDLMAVAYK